MEMDDDRAASWREEHEKRINSSRQVRYKEQPDE